MRGRVRTGRLALGAAALVVSGYATVSAYALAVRSRQPAAAYAAMPGDARVKAALAEQWSGPDATPAMRHDADALARAALARDPLNVSAVATLGINAQVAGDTPGARRLFAYGYRLSRRDLRSQIWAIEDAVARGSFRDALRHYDIALRTHATTPQLLFPILADAMAVPEVRASTVALLMRRPPWGDSFLGHLSGSAQPAAAGMVAEALMARGYRIPAAATNDLIASLVKANDLPRAWQIYAAIRPGVSRTTSRAPGFAQPAGAAAAFDWNPVSDGATAASIDTDGGRSMLAFSVLTGGSGTVAQQLQYLPAGRYALTGRITDLRQPAASRPLWTLTCLDGRELGRVEVPANGGEERFAGTFTVPANCPGQWLRLVARPSDALEGVTGTILETQLHPAG